MFLLNVMLALVWVALTGEFSPANFIEGLVIVSIIIGITQEATGRATYVRRIWRTVAFLGFFLKELLLASLKVAASVLSLRIDLTPGVIAVPLTITEDAEITLLANLITLTPGTLTLDIADDRSCIYVHTIDFDNAETFRAEIQNGFERRIHQLFEP